MPAMNTDAIDAFANLSQFTTKQLRVMNRHLDEETMRLCIEEGAHMTDEQKAKWFDAVNFMNRIGSELLRRRSLPSPGPTAVHCEVMPDGSAPIRFTTILAF